ncbi:MAG: four helix bundle protein [Bacteroidota bacterium]
MAKTQNSKHYNLEGRTLKFAKDFIEFVNSLPKTLSNAEISRQLIRSAGSVGANYIEANESLGKKDFLMKIRIARKEAKESRY